MINDPNILKEMKAISPMLAELQGKNVFNVPEGYFDTLSEKVLQSINLVGFPALSKSTPQKVPEGYFDNLSDNIMQRIKSETISEEDELQPYPVLVKDDRRNAFNVPEGYFDDLPARIIETIREKERARVIPFFDRKFWQYTAAAVMAVGLLMTSYFTFFNGRDSQRGFAVVNKFTVPDPAALKYNSTKSFNEGIASLSDDQIINYLENHGNILDNDLLIKNTDVNELPDVDDYLINDEALTNYLNKINNRETQKQ